MRPSSRIAEPTLDEFIVEFKKAIQEKDKKYVIENLSPQIQNSFGADGGTEEFIRSRYFTFLRTFDRYLLTSMLIQFQQMESILILI